VQIQLTSDPTSGSRRPTGDAVTSLEIFEGQQELLDDFLSRLQSIIRQAPASSPRSPDDTRPTGFRRRVRS
jgi:hypothetical protein